MSSRREERESLSLVGFLLAVEMTDSINTTFYDFADIDINKCSHALPIWCTFQEG